MAKGDVDLSGKTMDELDAIHEAVMKAKEEKAVEYQNELIREYQVLREKMVRAGVAPDDQLPKFKVRGWTRKKPH